MYLISKNKYYNDLPLGGLKDKLGVSLTPPSLSFINEPFVNVITYEFLENKQQYELTLEFAGEVEVGDNIIITDDTYEIASPVASVSRDKTKILLPIQKDFSNINTITKVKLNKKFRIDTSVDDGLYYSNNGDIIIIADGFDFSKTVTLELIRTVYPVLRDDKATEDWELIQIRNVAYLNIMGRLSIYEKVIADSYYNLNADIVKLMILKKISIIYQESLPTDNMLENKKIYKLERDLDKLFKRLIEVLSISRDDGSIDNTTSNLTLLEF